jgi:hypothetical protein
MGSQAFASPSPPTGARESKQAAPVLSRQKPTPESPEGEGEEAPVMNGWGVDTVAPSGLRLPGAAESDVVVP